MIDLKLLTPENGFVDDAIVLVEFDCSPSNTMPQYLIGRWEDIKFHFETGTLDFLMAIIKLSVLTGPMAIWNFAPEWALSLIRTPDQDIVWSRRIAADQPQEHTAQDRPWWAN